MRAILIFIVLLAQVKPQAPKPDLATPVKAVRSFVAAYSQLDLNTAGACVFGVTIGPEMQEAMKTIVPEMRAQLQGQAVMSVRNLKSTINGDTATVAAQVKVGDTPEHAESIPLRRAGAEWKIVAFDPKLASDQAKMQSGQMRERGIRLAATTFTLFPIFKEAREKARAISCLSNLKQIALGAIMFLQDNDEKFTLTAAGYKAKLMPYIKNEGVFRCPSDKEGAVSYSFNRNLEGTALSAMPHPSETVMVYEGKDGKLAFRHDGRASVSFADGIARLVNQTQAKSLRWKP